MARWSTDQITPSAAFDAPAVRHEIGAPPAVQDGVFGGSGVKLWIGASAVLVVFLVVIVALMLWRAGGAKGRVKGGAKRTRGAPEKDAGMFQPAGAEAEITFDEDAGAARTTETRPRPVPAAPRPLAPAPQDAADEEAEIFIDRGAPTLETSSAEEAPKPERRAQPFAALFAKRKKPEPATPVDEQRAGDLAEDEALGESAAADRHALESARRFDDDGRSGERRPIEAEAEEARVLSARLEEERQHDAARLAAAEDMRRRAIEEAQMEADRIAAAEMEARRAAAREAEAREDSRRRAAEREAEFERRKQQAAFEQRERDAQREREAQRAELMADDVKRHVSDEFERHFERFAATLGERWPQADSQSGAIDAELRRALERIGRDVAEHGKSVDGAIARLAQRVEPLAAPSREFAALREEMAALRSAVSDRFTGPAAAHAQIASLLRAALPAALYEQKALLGNHRRADYLVKLPKPPGPVAIDASFPIEAFQALHADEARDQVGAETEFRRVALRHVVAVAERMIAPGETAETAILFLPSETMFSELQSRFQDVVQDAFRARVLIVSPTTLLATLQAMRAILGEETTRHASDDRRLAEEALSEIETLRARVASLELHFEGFAATAQNAPIRSAPPAAPSGEDAEAPLSSAPVFVELMRESTREPTPAIELPRPAATDATPDAAPRPAVTSAEHPTPSFLRSPAGPR